MKPLMMYASGTHDFTRLISDRDWAESVILNTHSVHPLYNMCTSPFNSSIMDDSHETRRPRAVAKEVLWQKLEQGYL